MTIDGALRDHVLGDAGIAALVATRMYPIRLPQKVTLPALTYQLISSVREAQLRGSDGIARDRYQVDAYASAQPDALALGELVRQRLEAYGGAWTDASTSPDTTVQVAVFFETAMELFDPDINGGSCRHSADYFLIHTTFGGSL